MKALLLSFFTFTMSVTPSQFPTINSTDLDGTETIWVQKNGVDYKLSTDNFKQYGGCDVYCAELIIPTASVLTLNGTPVEIVSGVAGSTMQLLSASIQINYNSAAYAANTQVGIRCGSGSQPQMVSDANLLAVTNSVIRILTPSAATGTTDGQFAGDAGLEIYAISGNPTTGDSDIKVFIQYRIIAL